ncbi:MAG: PAS domain S-box protein [Rhodospirillales bacterium]|jgi:PAS domain S-box-containing protein|nr:PAS domain S-box protein [Rhodospirillales bacterium]
MAKSSIEHLRARYISVLAVLGLLAVGSYVLLDTIIVSQKTGAAEINIAGRQRMLSQRISFLGSQIYLQKNEMRRTAIQKELSQAIWLMHESHIGLTHGDVALGLSPPTSAKLKALYFGPDLNVDQDVLEFLEVAQKQSQALLEDMDSEYIYGRVISTKLLKNLDDIVNQYQVENEEKLAKLKTYQTLTIVVTLMLLGGAGLFVFQPMVTHVQEYVAKISETEERFRSITMSSSNAVIVAVDQKGDVIFWNPAAEETFGFSEDEIVGRSLVNIMPKRYREAHIKGLEHAVSTKEYRIIGKTVDIFGLKKNGEEFPIDLSLGTWSQDGQRYFSAIINDRTEQKLAEEKQIEAKEDAEKANMAKSEFLASMSHELRTPLNAVLGFSQMLQFDLKNPLTPIQNEHVESVIEGGNHLLELVNQILDLARIESDQFDLSLVNVNANDVVAECVALMAPIGEVRHITIIDQFSQLESFYISADKLRLKQILLNFLSNAVKFNRDKGSVTVRGQLTKNHFLKISISDTGIGIAEEDHKSLFHMFHRIGADSMVAREGTGIGLTVSKMLIDRMNGRVGFESKEDQGSTFWFELPIGQDKA